MSWQFKARKPATMCKIIPEMYQMWRNYWKSSVCMVVMESSIAKSSEAITITLVTFIEAVSVLTLAFLRIFFFSHALNK